jgi:tRNA (guanosine-2'-O-)-methyltransferase
MPRPLDRWLEALGADEIVARLAPHLTDRRRARIESVLASRLGSIELAIEEPYDPHNAAAAVRSAEAFGVDVIHVVAAHARVLRLRRTTAGTFHWVELVEHADFAAFSLHRRARGMLLAGACVDGTVALSDLPVDRPICLLLGNEHRGLSEQARADADLCFSIRTVGFAESLNLSVAAAIALHDLTSRRRAWIGRDGDLDPDPAARRRAAWYVRSVDARTARAVLGGPGGGG